MTSVFPQALGAFRSQENADHQPGLSASLEGLNDKIVPGIREPVCNLDIAQAPLKAIVNCGRGFEKWLGLLHLWGPFPADLQESPRLRLLGKYPYALTFPLTRRPGRSPPTPGD